MRLYLKKPFTENWAGGVAQGVGPPVPWATRVIMALSTLSPQRSSLPPWVSSASVDPVSLLHSGTQWSLGCLILAEPLPNRAGKERMEHSLCSRES
jgi:hypothetical protein